MPFYIFLPELIEHQELSAEAMGLWIIGGVLIGLITEKTSPLESLSSWEQQDSPSRFCTDEFGRRFCP